jgi:hypothetical protein
LNGAEALIMLANQHLQAVQLFLRALDIIQHWNCKPASRFVLIVSCSLFFCEVLQGQQWQMDMATKHVSYKTVDSKLGWQKHRLWSNDSQQGPPDIEQTLLAGCLAAHHAGPSASASC